jgi:hypothetical protein
MSVNEFEVVEVSPQALGGPAPKWINTDWQQQGAVLLLDHRIWYVFEKYDGTLAQATMSEEDWEKIPIEQRAFTGMIGEEPRKKKEKTIKITKIVKIKSKITRPYKIRRKK